MDTNYELMLPLHFVTASLGIYDNQRLILLYHVNKFVQQFFCTWIVAGISWQEIGKLRYVHSCAHTAT